MKSRVWVTTTACLLALMPGASAWAQLRLKSDRVLPDSDPASSMPVRRSRTALAGSSRLSARSVVASDSTPEDWDRPSGKRLDPARSHWIATFTGDPSRTGADALEQHGLREVESLPGNVWIVSAETPSEQLSTDGAAGSQVLAGFDGWRQFTLADKVSPALRPSGVSGANTSGSNQQGVVIAQDESAPAGLVVEFYSDVPPADARTILLRENLTPVENPGLSPRHLLVHGDGEVARRLADWDEVAYVFPASAELMEGWAVHACAGALGGPSSIGQYIASVGEGWDGAGAHAVSLGYYWGALTSQIPAALAEDEILRALSEWAKYIQLRLTPEFSAGKERTLDILFASGDHGDGYPFDGPGKVLAHTFFPAPPNPEPIAGDMHLDADETWQVGADLDLYSVVLHEMGHALGLAHSDVPGSVMYPYYRRATSLTSEDISAAQRLYAARDSSGGDPSDQPEDPPETPDDPDDPSDPSQPPSEPVRLAILSPTNGDTYQTTQAAVTLAGTAGGGSGIVLVSWAASTGAAGAASGTTSWSTGPLVLQQGDTVFTITAQDAAGASALKPIRVTYTPPTPPASPDNQAPSLEITYPYANSVATSSASITVRGKAHDNVAVVAVLWSTSTGATGVAAGTTNWSSAPIPLLVGINMITIRARDEAGNESWRSLSVRRR